jgi:HD-GYP domain-containing protein (c-di-GMP phosphodiesterase class II)
VTTTAASVASDDAFVRDARARDALGRLQGHAPVVYAAWSPIVLAACVAAMWLPGGPQFSIARFAFFVGLYAVVSRVEFESGNGSAIPTQLVLVPMLFAMPVGMVPLAVAAGLALRDPRALLRPTKLLPLVASAAHALGPTLVLAVGGGVPLRWSAWPIYVAALTAQFAFDLAHSVITGFAHRIAPRTVVGFLWLVYAVDASLAPVGLVLAFAAIGHVYVVGLLLPLVALLRLFSGERQRRIDSALELSDAYRGTAFLLGDVVEADDAYTGSHSRHVVDLVLGVADVLGLSPDDRRDAEFVALLHDVGKIRIPSEIINKPGPLDAEERAIIETHTIEGERMLEQVGGLIGHVGELVRSCHERWDGGGYPDGLAGEDIPLIARIVCACDAYSAMTTDRSYRKALGRDEALDELRRCAGTHFDPQVVDAILRVDG